VFTGSWAANKQNGRGVLKQTDGQEKEGEWHQGKVVWWYNENGSRADTTVMSLRSASLNSLNLTSGSIANKLEAGPL